MDYTRKETAVSNRFRLDTVAVYPPPGKLKIQIQFHLDPTLVVSAQQAALPGEQPANLLIRLIQLGLDEDFHMYSRLDQLPMYWKELDHRVGYDVFTPRRNEEGTLWGGLETKAICSVPATVIDRLRQFPCFPGTKPQTWRYLLHRGLYRQLFDGVTHADPA